MHSSPDWHPSLNAENLVYDILTLTALNTKDI
jgi:hypothetical protein